MKKTNKVISLVLALVMALSILVVIPTASATSTVRINEVNANVGYSIVSICKLMKRQTQWKVD